jgi:hypothetical protein
MSLGEFIAAGEAYAAIMDPNGSGSKPPPSDEDFDDMLASARAIGFLSGAET